MKKDMCTAKDKKGKSAIGDEGRSIIKKQVEMSRQRKMAQDLIARAVTAYAKKE